MNPNPSSTHSERVTLITGANINRMRAIGKAAFFQQNMNLVAIGRRP